MFEFEILKKKISFKFSENLKKNHKKRHISETTRIWAVTLGDKIRNPREYSDSTQLEVLEIHVFKIISLFLFSENFGKKTQKSSHSYTKRIWAFLIVGQIRNPLGNPDSVPLLGCLF